MHITPTRSRKRYRNAMVAVDASALQRESYGKAVAVLL